MTDSELASWLDLYFRVDQTLRALGGERLLHAARAVGLKRQADLLRTVHREKQRLEVEIEAIGICPLLLTSPPEAVGRSSFLSLAAAFTDCAPAARRVGRNELTRWLLAHAYGHRQQARIWTLTVAKSTQ